MLYSIDYLPKFHLPYQFLNFLLLSNQKKMVQVNDFLLLVHINKNSDFKEDNCETEVLSFNLEILHSPSAMGLCFLNLIFENRRSGSMHKNLCPESPCP